MIRKHSDGDRETVLLSGRRVATASHATIVRFDRPVGNAWGPKLAQAIGFGVIAVVLVAPLAAQLQPRPQSSRPQSGQAKSGQAKSGARQAPGRPSDAEIQKLIEQLGARQYTERVQAQRQLEAIGLYAFDAIFAAQQHEDVEIASRASYLIRSIKIIWSTPQDPVEVRRLLRGHGNTPSAERLNRIQAVAALKEPAVMPVLARLARYESSRRLSKRAALLAMSWPNQNTPSRNRPNSASEQLAEKKAGPLSAPQRVAIANQLRQVLDGSRRQASAWLVRFADILEDQGKGKQALADFADLARREEDLLIIQPTHSSRQIVRRLYRWYSEVLADNRQDQLAEQMVSRVIQYLDGSQAQTLEVFDWLSERQAWKMLDKLPDQFPREFSTNPTLMYRLAESYLQRGQHERAEKLAGQAREQSPDDSTAHFEIAQMLSERSLAAWSLAEYQQVIKHSPPESIIHIDARLTASEAYHDELREGEAAEVLKPVVEALKKKNIELLVMQKLSRDPNAIRSRYEYFAAQHLAKSDLAAARTRLLAGLKAEPHDPDVLIALYRLTKDSKEWKEDTAKRIAEATKYYRDETEEQRRQMPAIVNTGQLSRARLRLAYFDNQFAWLVSNTGGDAKEAIRLSHESLKLRPNTSAYLDTLGRCYYAAKDFENAIKYQREAIRLEPNSASMKRQLKLFLEAQQAAAAE